MEPGARSIEFVPHGHKDVPQVQNHYVDAIESSGGKSIQAMISSQCIEPRVYLARLFAEPPPTMRAEQFEELLP